MVTACLSPGCGAAEPVCALDQNQPQWQAAPRGAAVAMVHTDFYNCLLTERPNQLDLAVVIEGFFEAFTNEVDAVVIVQDVESSIITLSRLFLEQGYDPFEGMTSIPDSVVEQVNRTFADQPRPLASAFNTTYRSFESGIGRRTFAPVPASPASFRGVVFLPTREDLAAGRLLHEFAHFWAAYLSGPTGLADRLRAFANHWGFSSVGGVLGGWATEALLDLGENTYAAHVASAGRAASLYYYAPLELYLMGLAAPEEVPPVQLALDVAILSRDDTGLTTFQTNDFATITIEDIIATNGPRLPAYAAPPIQFDIALVVLTDHFMSEMEWEFYDRAIAFASAGQDDSLHEHFPQQQYPIHDAVWQAQIAATTTEFAPGSTVEFLNFSAATRGRGQLHFVTLNRAP